MADKKEAAPSPFHEDHYKEVIYGVLPGLLVLAYILNRLVIYLNSVQYSAATSIWDRIIHAFLHMWDSWKPIAVVLSLAAAAALAYCRFELRKIEHEEEKIFGHAPEDTFLDIGPTPAKQNERWERVLKHAHSENPAEWRVAIIEADIMLEELMKTLGYVGDGLGDMLKQVEPSDMLTLDKAWEAHKIRNRIAHAGQDFDLNDRETRRVISLFEDVFNEYQII